MAKLIDTSYKPTLNIHSKTLRLSCRRHLISKPTMLMCCMRESFASTSPDPSTTTRPLSLPTSHRQLEEHDPFSYEACADFSMAEHVGSSWTVEDCVSVWESFARSLRPWMRPRFPLIDHWGGTAVELRRAGTPCLVAPTSPHDGVGSSTIRHLATWIFSEQMGCDWVTPDWGGVSPSQGNGSVVYCHRTATTEEFAKATTREEQDKMRRCTIANWLSFFQFDVPSVPLPLGEKLKIVEVRTVREQNRTFTVVKT